jgi:glycosyltransferase involved in cell wall biosynthesis
MTTTHQPNVAMFAYHFPPCVCWPTASTRAEGLANGLVASGWSPIVVTRANGCACLDGPRVDETVPARVQPVAPALEVRRVRLRRSSIARLRDWADRRSTSATWRPLALVMRKPLTTLLVLTDAKNDWVRAASAAGRRLLQERHVDAVWTTAPPYRTVHVGRRLQRRHGMPWVADLRDSIARSYSSDDRSRTGRRIAKPIRFIPRQIWMRDLRRASEVICVSPQEAESDGAALRRNVRSVPSGFELSTWRDLRSRSEREAPDMDTFRVLYAGSVLGRIQDPEPFLSGLRLFLDMQSAVPAISVDYIGPSGAQFRARADQHGVGAIFEEFGMLPVEQARTMMCQADLLLLLCPSNGGSGIPGGKLYEYLAAGPPILAVPATDAFVREVLCDTGAGDVASTCAEVADVVGRRYEAWRTGHVGRRSLDGLSGFTWAARGMQLAALLDELVPGRG